VFKVRQVGKTLVNRTAGTRIASDGLKGRVYEVSLADLQSENDAERSFRKFKLICEDVQVAEQSFFLFATEKFSCGFYSSGPDENLMLEINFVAFSGNLRPINVFNAQSDNRDAPDIRLDNPVFDTFYA
jgi:hypothetical protein